MADFSLRGVDDCKQRLTSIARNSREALSSVALEETEHIRDRAKELVPVRKGALRDTIKVVKGELSQGRDTGGRFTEGSTIEVVVVAGDDSTPHALAVHEHPSRHSPPSWEGVNVKFNPSGTGPKYLERPLLDSVQGMADRVGSKVSAKLG